jgi:hypothetical protein
VQRGVAAVRVDGEEMELRPGVVASVGLVDDGGVHRVGVRMGARVGAASR